MEGDGVRLLPRGMGGGEVGFGGGQDAGGHQSAMGNWMGICLEILRSSTEKGKQRGQTGTNAPVGREVKGVMVGTYCVDSSGLGERSHSSGLDFVYKFSIILFSMPTHAIPYATFATRAEILSLIYHHSILEPFLSRTVIGFER